MRRLQINYLTKVLHFLNPLLFKSSIKSMVTVVFLGQICLLT
jgi:hypothetical protein